ncbi:MAG: pyridine nucleotide-disulfide oxidoreductase [Proteobacteria bacterium]|nr:MAG: pyridine nucleotide-disulfide oxidoreductase [Pseudomonadota bacterium]
MTKLKLAHGLAFEDLYSDAGLARIDRLFLDQLTTASASVAEALTSARHAPDALSAKDEANLLLEVAPQLESFLAHLFGIEREVKLQSAAHDRLSPLYAVKRLFVQRRALKGVSAQDVARINGEELAAELSRRFGASFHSAADELVYAEHVQQWMNDADNHVDDLNLAARYAAWAMRTPDGIRRHGKAAGGVLFQSPSQLDFEHLVHGEIDHSKEYAVHRLPAERVHQREGFKLTDSGAPLKSVLDQASYCIYCHNQGKDSCSKGLREKVKGEEGAPFRDNPLGVKLAGCPLEVKISEMNFLKGEGRTIAALAMIIVTNPMLAGTGHRICNDCMKACVYQKQDPVDIPQIENRILKDTLALPWGFEIYSLLSRWNPLNLRRPLPRPRTGKRVLVAGMGPAGYTLAHHLLNEGHTVVGVDGLKIEPLPPELCGVQVDGARTAFRPIRSISELQEALDDRIMWGFGGVAEYGITVRWDKNFLKMVRLLLQRRERFALIGGVRFGGTLTVEDAFARGFDHIALAVGAGRPTLIPVPRGLVRGVRAASDFLMALQLTGAAKTDSIANMQLRMPVVVIGGGLTAIDTATEALAYYPVQVEKFLARYETVVAERGEATVRAKWSPEEQSIADEFLGHARAIRLERATAAHEKRAPRILDLMKSWGGVTLAYRKRLIDSPSYTLNHEEIEKALGEGIQFAECLSPISVEIDQYGHASHIMMNKQRLTREGKWLTLDALERLPAKSILIAAGTQPNTVLAREDGVHFKLDDRYFQAYDENGNPVDPERSKKPKDVRVLTSFIEDGRAVSFFGDLHPSFAGNVVSAMASALQGYPTVSRILERVPPANGESDDAFIAALNHDLRAVVHKVERLAHNIVEVTIQAPQAARKFEPGQFYRLQNFETLAPKVGNTRLAMEGLALTGAWVDRKAGLVSVIVLEMGGSSDLCAYLKSGQPVVLMGPTGSPTEIVAGETVLLVGGGLGNAVLFSIGQALRRAGSRVLYFAGYKTIGDRYKIEEIEAAADAIVWCCDQAPGFQPGRKQDKTFVGNIVQALVNYGEGTLGEPEIPLREVDRVVVIGSDMMMAAVARARSTSLAPHLKPGVKMFASINSPMQCMMKEICAQCVQTHVNPETGEQTLVFSCFNQDQPLEQVNFNLLNSRLRQNSTVEKLTSQWIDRCLVQMGARAKSVTVPSEESESDYLAWG